MRRGLHPTDHAWIFFKESLNLSSLDPFAPSVDQPNLTKMKPLRCIEIGVQHSKHIGRAIGMQVECLFDGDLIRFFRWALG